LDIALKGKFINHNLWEAIKAQGYSNINEFCRVAGMSASLIGRYINLKSIPVQKNVCKKLEEKLHCPIDYLFLDDLCAFVKKKPITEVYAHKRVDLLSLENIKGISYVPDLDFDKAGEIDKVLDTLTKRERKVVELRYGLDTNPKTYQEVGEEMSVTPERARQIELRALRKLRHPIRSRELEVYVN
jgi:DNA-binding CsgD family transcriptional regulator